MNLFESCFQLIVYAWDQMKVYIWSIYDTLGAWKYIMAMLFAMLVIRNVLYPFLKDAVAVGGSDPADYERPKGSYFYYHESFSTGRNLPSSRFNRKKLGG